LANRKLKPIETRPLDAKASCSFRDPNGYRGNLRLEVKQASVKRFQASVEVPKHGACRFDLKNFEQTETTPNVVLSAKSGGCRVSLWEQAHQLTVAFSDGTEGKPQEYATGTFVLGAGAVKETRDAK
jgi:hypothetical protein